MQRPRFRVFISSPGDVSEERRIVASAVDRLRRRFAGACELVEYRWENDVFLATDGGFQEQIARASEFDLCVFILWSRLGTPLSASFNRPDGTPYQSGTEFEFDDAVEGSRRRGRPYVILFRKVRKCVLDLSDDADTVHERVTQYRRLESFISSRMKGPDGAFLHAFNEFDAADELETKVSQKLEQLILRLLAGEGDGAAAAPPAQLPAPAAGRAGASPFRGLRRFEPADADLYFGRRRATQEVLEQLRARADSGSPFVLVFGGSGVGKSSFARAGLLPFLTDPGVIAETRAWRWSIFEPSDSTGDLIDGLAATLLTGHALPRLAARMPEAELARALRGRESTLIAFLRTELASHAGIDLDKTPVNGTPFPVRYALLIDPVEEIFTRQGATAEDREAFLQTLEWLLGTGLFWVVGTMRSDFFDRCAEHRRLLDLKHGNGQYHLPPPSQAELSQMIRLPAQSAGLEFETDPVRGPLDDFLLEEASKDPGALPLLEFTLDEVWKKSDAGRTGRLTFRAFDELGGVRGAISSRAREVLSQIRARLGGRTDKALSAVFGMLVGTGDRADHAVVRLYSPLAHFDRDRDQRVVVDALVEARLFLTDIDDENHPVVTLGHESLLRHWPELVEWVEENREFLMLRERIDRGARQWAGNGKHADYLLGEGRPLVEGRHLLDNNRQGMTPLQVEFVEQSTRADRERQRARVSRQRRFTAMIAALAVVATVGFAVTWYQRRQAIRQRTTAVAQAKGSHKLVQDLLNEVRENLSPTEKKDAALIAKLSERVTSHYEQLRLQDDSEEVRAQHAQSLMGLCQSFAKIRDFDRASRLANEVVQIRTEIYGPDDPSIAEALLEAGRARDQMSDYAAAEASYERGIKALEANRAGREGTLVALYGSRGELCRHLGRYAEARHWEGQALALSDQLGNPAPLEYARRLNDLGELCRNMRELDQADRFLLDARARAEALTEPDQGLRGEITGNLGVLRYDQKRYPEAETLLRQALEMDTKALGAGHPIVAADRYKLARVAIATEKSADAADLVAAAERVLDDPAGRQKARLAKCLEVKADLLLARKDLAAAEQAARRVLDIRSALFTPPHPDLVHTYEQLAEVLTAENRAEDAGRAKQSADAMRRQIKARDDEMLARLKKG